MTTVSTQIVNSTAVQIAALEQRHRQTTLLVNEHSDTLESHDVTIGKLQKELADIRTAMAQPQQPLVSEEIEVTRGNLGWGCEASILGSRQSRLPMKPVPSRASPAPAVLVLQVP